RASCPASRPKLPRHGDPTICGRTSSICSRRSARIVCCGAVIGRSSISRPIIRAGSGWSTTSRTCRAIPARRYLAAMPFGFTVSRNEGGTRRATCDRRRPVLHRDDVVHACGAGAIRHPAEAPAPDPGAGRIRTARWRFDCGARRRTRAVDRGFPARRHSCANRRRPAGDFSAGAGPHHPADRPVDPRRRGLPTGCKARRVAIAAADERGLFWGVQTFRQLLPLQHEVPPAIPAVSIEDAPRYAWRGVMLDTARHFYPVEFIKQQIDLMSYYKFDVFHWHLTDDQGWRIQVNRYPKLTSVGAWRTEADGNRDGGFYTQNQIREVVEYARERNVMVVPEIEMPGHTSAAIAAYPELSCSGKPITVPTTWGVFRDVDCVGKDATFKFLQHVLDEVIALFPSPYVHIGGDEVPEGVWADCAACQALAHTQGLNGEQGLHGYFVRRIQTYLAGKGKTMAGWDEILEGQLDPGAIVEVWRGPDEAKKALANGNRIIIASPFYLDTPIDRMTLQDLYRTDPFDNPLFAKYPGKVLGGEAPLWSERATPLNGDARLYPRLLAVGEHMWNPGANDWLDFLLRARAQEAWLASQQVAYGPEDKDIVDARISFNPTYKRWRIRAARGFDDLRLHYTTDGSQPTAQSPSFGDVRDLYAPATLTVAPFRGDVQYQASETFRMVQNLALGDPVTFATPPSAKYSADLTDGILGSEYDDGTWAGWQNADMD